MAGISVGPGLGPYLASKHAVVALTEALAVELAHAAPNVGVTVVCPGQVATNIVASERNRPAELAVEQQELRADVIGSSFAWMQTISAPYRMPPAEAAEIVLRAIESDTLHILPNGSSAGVRTWVDRLLADLPGN
jgi:NAD(P)-dependent dehydrogenase (short-subunit alcohol dehydrogenase family)